MPRLLYRGRFVSAHGTERWVVGQTQQALADRQREYRAKGPECPAFAKCARGGASAVCLTEVTKSKSYHM